MEFAEVVARRRMRRSFTGAPVDPAVLDHILDVAGSGPSAGNAQGWDGVVLVGPTETDRFWDATTTAEWRASSSRWPGLHRAPVVIALFAHAGAYLARYSEADKTSSGLGVGAEAWAVPYWLLDTGNAALLVLLAAVDAGLGACFLGNFRGEAELRRALHVPDDRRYVGAVLIGEPATDDPPSVSAGRERRPAQDRFHRGRW